MRPACPDRARRRHGEAPRRTCRIACAPGRRPDRHPRGGKRGAVEAQDWRCRHGPPAFLATAKGPRSVATADRPDDRCSHMAPAVGEQLLMLKDTEAETHGPTNGAPPPKRSVAALATPKEIESW